MAATPFCFIDDAAVSAGIARAADNPTLTGVPSYDTGMNRGASNAPGIGISDDNPNLEESLPSWTLLDQFGNARAAQRSQCIGGPGISDPSESNGEEGTLPAAVTRFCTNPANVDGAPDNDAPIVTGNGCDLVSLATGWEDAL